MTAPTDHDRLGDSLRDLFERDAARVPLARPEWDGLAALRSPPPPRRSRALVAIAAALMVVLGAAVAMVATQGDGEPVASVASPGVSSTESGETTTIEIQSSSAPSSTTAPPTTQGALTTTTGEVGTTTESPDGELAPPVTLPATPQTTMPPSTGPGPELDYYRMAPDLDLAWLATETGTRLCWRTPIDEDCEDEPDPGPDRVATLAIPSSESHTIVLVTDTRGQPVRPRVTVELTGGDSFSGTPRWDDPILALGLLRVPFPAAAISEIVVQ